MLVKRKPASVFLIGMGDLHPEGTLLLPVWTAANRLPMSRISLIDHTGSQKS